MFRTSRMDELGINAQRKSEPSTSDGEVQRIESWWNGSRRHTDDKVLQQISNIYSTKRKLQYSVVYFENRT